MGRLRFGRPTSRRVHRRSRRASPLGGVCACGAVSLRRLERLLRAVARPDDDVYVGDVVLGSRRSCGPRLGVPAKDRLLRSSRGARTGGGCARRGLWLGRQPASAGRAHAVRAAIGLTLSAAQQHWISEHPIPDAEVRLENWNDHEPIGRYDAIVSYGAFEHFARDGTTRVERVDAYRRFFARCFEWLKPDGRLGLETIAHDDAPDTESPLGRGPLGDVVLNSIRSRSVRTCRRWSSGFEPYFEVELLRSDAADFARTMPPLAPGAARARGPGHRARRRGDRTALSALSGLVGNPVSDSWPDQLSIGSAAPAGTALVGRTFTRCPTLSLRRAHGRQQDDDRDFIAERHDRPAHVPPAAADGRPGRRGRRTRPRAGGSAPQRSPRAIRRRDAPGSTAVEFRARLKQTGPTGEHFIAFGYLTRVGGATDDDLFAGASQNETTALLTAFASGDLSRRTIDQSVHSIDIEGSLTIYQRPCPAHPGTIRLRSRSALRSPPSRSRCRTS